MVTCFGEALIDFFPNRLGVPLEEVEAFLPVPGGAPANVAVAVSRLGTKSAFMGKVGNDAFGRILEKVLRENGVNVRGLRFDNCVRTTCVFIAQPDPQSQEFLFFRHPGADMMFNGEDIDFGLLGQTRVFHSGSLSLTNVPIREALWEILWLCREKRIFVSFDVNYRPSLWESEELARNTICEVLPCVDLLKVNLQEFYLLTQKNSIEEGIAVLLKGGVRNVVVTMGSEGAFLGNDLGCKKVMGYQVEVVDTTGCGDGFIAGILSRIDSCEEAQAGWKIPLEAFEGFVRFGHACGALTATKRGVIPALPTREAVENFLWERSGGILGRNTTLSL